MSNRGLASADTETRHRVATKGGQARGQQLHEEAEQRREVEGNLQDETPIEGNRPTYERERERITKERDRETFNSQM